MKKITFFILVVIITSLFFVTNITAQTPARIPYVQDFENTTENANWTLQNGTQTNKWYIGSATTNGGSKALYISNDNGTINAYSTSSTSYVYAYRLINFGETAIYDFSFDWKAYGESNYDLLRAFLVPVANTSSLTGGTNNGMSGNNNQTPANWIDISQAQGKLNLQTTWQHSDYSSDVTAGDYNLVFFWKNDNGVGTTPPAAIDNLSITKASCRNPINLTIANITTTSAYLSWSEVGTSTSWQYVVSTTALVDPSTGTIVDVTDSTATINDLTLDTDYFVYLRAFCSDEEQSAWISRTFTTACEVLDLPYSEDFDSYTNGISNNTSYPSNYPICDLPSCWTFLNRSESSSSYPKVFLSSFSLSAVSGNCLFFSASQTTPLYAVLPQFTENIENMLMEFTYRNESTYSSNGTLHVGIMNDLSDVNSYIDLKSYTITTTKTSETLKFADYTYSGQYYIVFKYVGGSGNDYFLSIDNVSVRSLVLDNDIISFELADQIRNAVIDTENHTVNAEVYFSSDITEQTPIITVSDYATINPESGVTQDFTNPVTYTVTAENGATQEWTVTVVNTEIPSNSKDILSFSFANQIGTSIIDTENHTVSAVLKWNGELSLIFPDIEVSRFAQIAPASGDAQNFVVPVVYTVTAEDGSSVDWFVSIVRDESACPNIDDADISSLVTVNTAVFSWQKKYNETSYNYVLSENVTDPSVETAEVVNEPLLILSGLTPSTDYYLYIQPNCGTDEWIRVDFTTFCEVYISNTNDTFFENFESSSETTNCWAPIDADNDGSAWNLSRNYAAYSTRYSNSESIFSVNDWLVSPLIHLEEIADFYFDYKMDLDDEEAKISLYVMDSTKSLASAVQIIPTQIISNTDFETSQFFNLSDYVGRAIYIGIKLESISSASSIIIDNFTVEVHKTCPKPGALAIDNITTTSAELSWTETGTATAWQVEVTMGGETQTFDVTEPTYTITGLTAATSYDVSFRVKAVCREEDQSEWSDLLNSTFTTQCGVFDFPFSENFNGTTSGIPLCWDNSEGTTTEASYRWNYYATGYEGKCLRFDSYNNYSGNTNMLKTPIISLPENPTVLSFFCKNPAGGDFSVYISTDGGTTYTNALLSNLTSISSWTEYTCPLNDYIGQNVVIVFKGISNWGSRDAYIYIDNVTIELAPTCPRPTELAIDNITATSAELSWTEAGTATAWQVEVTIEGETQTYDVTENSYTITGLTATTSYSGNFRVKAVCSDEDQSGWSSPSGTFTTQCEAFDLPFSEDFESSSFPPSCWEQKSGLASAAFAGTLPAENTDGWIYYTSSNGLATNHTKVNVYGNYQYWLVTPEISLTGNELLTFDIAFTDYDDPDSPELIGEDDKFMVLVSTDGGSSWSESNVVLNYTNTDLQAVPNDRTTISVNMSAYTGNVKIAFYAESTISNSINDLHLDNVIIETIPTCPKPTALTVENISSTEAIVSWAAGAEESAWDVVVSTTAIENPSLEGSLATVTTNSYNATDLILGSTYYVYVRANCGTDDVSRWINKSFHSGYCEPAPTSVDGSGINTVSFGVNTLVNNTTSHPTVAPFYMDNTSMIGDVQAGTEATVNITYGTGYTYGTVIWVDFNNNFEFENSEEVYFGQSTSSIPTTLVATFNIPIATVPGLYRMRIGGSDFDFDDPDRDPCLNTSYTIYEDYTLQVTSAPTCVYPTNLGVTAAATSADLSWTENGTATAWQVELTMDGETQTIDVTGTPLYTITGLTALTSYEVSFRVKAVCSDEDQSEWSAPLILTITTQCDVFDFPFSENFNGTTSGIPPCWDNSEGTTTDASYRWNSNTIGYEGNCIRFNSFDNTSGLTNMLKTPVISLSENSFLSFFCKNSAGGDFSVYISTDGGATYPNALLTNLTSISSWTEYTCPLNDYAGQNVVIVFKGTSNYGSEGAFIYLDNVTVRTTGTDNDILSFVLPKQLDEAVIDQEAHTVNSTISFSSDITEQTPTITISNAATISPASGVVQDFTNPVTYTVTAENGTAQEWIVSVTKATVASSLNDIVAFTFPNQIGESVIDLENHTVTAVVQWYQSLTMSPTIETSVFSTINPRSGVPRNFSNSLGYNVIAEDGTIQRWTIYVSSPEIPVGATLENPILVDFETTEFPYSADGLTCDFHNDINDTFGGETAVAEDVFFKLHITENTPLLIEASFVSEDYSVALYNSNNTTDEIIALLLSESNSTVSNAILLSPGDYYLVVDSNIDTCFHYSIDLNNEYCLSPSLSINEESITASSVEVLLGQLLSQEDEWELNYVVSGDESSTATTILGTGYNYVIDSLIPETSYSVSVRKICGEDYGEWNNIVFNTASECPKPTYLVVSGLTSNSATITWDGAFLNDWILKYKMSDETEWTSIENIATESYVLTNLNSARSYKVMVVAVCEGEESESSIISFTTDCSAIEITEGNSYHEGFENSDIYRGCWKNEFVVGGNAWSYLNGDNGGNFAYEGGLNASFRTSSSVTTKLVSPCLNISSSSVGKLTFWHAQKVNSTDELRRMSVYYKNSLDAEWIRLKNYEEDIPIWTYEELLLPNTTSTYWIAFEVETNYTSYSAVVDDVTISVASDENDIVSFGFSGISEDVTIDNLTHTVNVEVPYSANRRLLIPEITVSAGASILNYTEGVSRNFMEPVVFSVISEIGTVQDWSIVVTNDSTPNTGVEILSFSVPNQIGETVIDYEDATVTLQIPWYASLENIVPFIEISENATIIPNIGTAINFTNEVIYSVKNEACTTVKIWMVNITKQSIPEGYTCSNPIVLDFSQITLPYAQVQSTCGSFNDVSNSCLYDNDEGEDFFYRLDIDEITSISISVVASNGPFGIALSEDCYMNNCLQTANGSLGEPSSIDNIVLNPGSYYLMIDSYEECLSSFALTITSGALSCQPPVVSSITDKTQTSAVVNWIPFYTESAWDLKYGLSGFSVFVDGITVNDVEPMHTITGLLPNNEYDVYLRSNCGDNTSEWSQVYTFKTLSDCPTPEDLHISSISSNSLSISWNGHNASEWEVKCLNVNNNLVASDTVTESTCSFNNLTESNYIVEVKALCGTESSSSNSIRVPLPICDEVATLPYSQDFSGSQFPPTCWSQYVYSIGTGGGTQYPMGAWISNALEIGENRTEKAQMRDTKLGAKSGLSSVKMQFENGLEYSIRLDVYRNSSLSNSINEGIEILISETPYYNSEEDAVSLGFISRNYTVASSLIPSEQIPGWYTYEFRFIATGNSFITVLGRSQHAGSIYVDNLYVDVVPDCETPTAIAVSNVTNSSFDLSWNERNETTEWQVEYSLNNGATQTFTTTENPYTIEGLSTGAIYDLNFKVKSLCSETSESSWSENFVTAIQTECDAISIPYYETFDSQNNLPLCWRSQHISGSSSTAWAVSNSLTYNSSDYAVSVGLQPAGNRNLLITPKFDIQTFSKLEFMMKQYASATTSNEYLNVYYNAEPSIDGAFFIGQASTMATQSGWNKITFDIPIIQLGEYYIIFESVHNGIFPFILDNIKIRQVASDADILTYEVENQLSVDINASEKSVLVQVPFNTTISNFYPEYTISEGASVISSPESLTLNNPSTYLLISEDGQTINTWTVTIIKDVAVCVNPTDLAFDNSTNVLSVQKINTETAYNVKVSSESINPVTDHADIVDSVFNVTGDVTNIELQTLNNSTVYYVYVQSNCGIEEWQSLQIETQCGAVTVPFIQTFDNDILCWDIRNENNDSKTWILENGMMKYSYSSFTAANDYLISPQLIIPESATLKFDYHVELYGYPEVFKVLVYNSLDDLSNPQVLLTKTARNESFETITLDLQAFAGQNIYIAIKCESPANRYYLYVDNFKVIPPVHNITANVVGNGTISPAGQTPVFHGASQTFTFEATANNNLVSVFVDSIDVTSEIVDMAYTIDSVVENHTITATFSSMFTIMATAGQNGFIEPSGEIQVSGGGSQSFIIVPDNLYKVASIVIDSVDVTNEIDSYAYTFENINANHSINVSFEEIVYHSITATAGEHGTISPAGTTSVEDGASLIFEITPDEEYRIAQFIVDDVNMTASLVNNTYTFENITSDHVVEVSFDSIPVYVISAQAGENGTISPSGNVLVNEGGDAEFVIIPNEGYHVATLLIDGISVPTQNEFYTFRNVTDNHSITVTFAINTYNITAFANNGTITPTGAISVNYGEDVTFEFTPNEGYVLANVFVDNVVSQVSDSTYTFNNVTSNHTIAVIFVPETVIRYSIVASSDELGQISPSGNISVVEGESQEFEIIPNQHCYIGDILVDDVSVGAVDTYSFTDVHSNHTIFATFEHYTHTITASAGGNGIISPNGNVVVNEAESKTFYFNPIPGYIVDQVFVDNELVEVSGDYYTFDSVMTDRSIRVTFKSIPIRTIVAAAGANGTISPSGTLYMYQGDSQTFTFTPDEGYMVESIVVDGVNVSNINNTYSFENITANHYIYVNFRTLAYFIEASTDGNGSITPSGTVEVQVGEDQIFTFEPLLNYELDSLIIDGEPVDIQNVINNSYTFENVNENHSIRVTFRLLTSIDEDITSFSLYPNPNNGIFNVEFGNINETITYQLINVNGAIIESREISVSSGNNLTFSYVLLPGTYFVRIIALQKTYVEQFIVE